MKTKVKSFSVIAIFAVAMGVNASLNSNKSHEDVSLSELVNLSDANAERSQGVMLNGRCNWLGTMCHLNPFPED